MGLDMYLTMGAGDERQTIFQWRKANQLRAWFVRRASLNPNEEVEVVLDKADIIQLRNDIQSALLNPKRAPYILPTQAGFFFGSTDYDDYYFETLAGTHDVLERILVAMNKGVLETVTYSEWW